ncbi:hypothetical protein D3C71_1879210 [compost metagenome]
MATGPPSVGMPSGIGMPVRMPSGPSSLTVPMERCQAILRVFRSMAVIMPNGGSVQGTPSCEVTMARLRP